MIGQYSFTLIGSFLLGILFISALKKFSLTHKLLIHKGIPLIGGLGMGLAFILISLLISLLYQGLSKEMLGLIISSIIMLVFGAIDDWRELSIWAKFIAQIIAAIFLIIFGIKTQIVYIGNLLNIIITFIWVLGITNAFNHLDVMDGLSSGAAMIIAFSFFAISILNGDTRSAILSLALIGAVAGFFLYNFPPAKVYLGNSGSHFLGFALGTVALIISYAPLERKIALLTPLLILGLPIFDTAFVILMRMRKKKSPFSKSNDHLALRFLALGYSKKKTLSRMLFLCLFFSFCAIGVSKAANAIGAGIAMIVILVSLIVTLRMSKVPLDA